MSDPASAAPSRRRRWDLPGDSAPPADATSDPAAIENAKRLAMERARALAASASVSLLSSGASGSAPRNGADGAGDDDFGAIVPAGQNFTFDVEINDCRNRYNLTKSTSQHEIKNQTGCEITTRGKYYPDKSKATALDPPLHLHLSATSKEALDSAVARIKDIMEQQPDPLLEQRTSFLARPGGRDSDEQGGGDTGRGRGNMQPLLTDKIVIDFGQDRYFNVRSKIIGPRGLYVKHIQAETNVRLQLKGQGSGFCENATGRESDEPLHVHMQTTVGEAALEKARTLLVDLLAQVRSDYEKWKTGRTQGGGGDFRGGDGFRNGPPGGGDGFDRDRDRPPMQQMPPMQQHDRYGAPPSSSYGAPGAVARGHGAGGRIVGTRCHSGRSSSTSSSTNSNDGSRRRCRHVPSELGPNGRLLHQVLRGVRPRRGHCTRAR
ncbi:hypothetical protein BC828DRAFT_439043 [Blastocladiella britannica]|nr:hypothetical protein BC828DRAFT_439043 [Blastocladiella britannica]